MVLQVHGVQKNKTMPKIKKIFNKYSISLLVIGLLLIVGLTAKHYYSSAPQTHKQVETIPAETLINPRYERSSDDAFRVAKRPRFRC